jgi:hypothetical protein
MGLIAKWTSSAQIPALPVRNTSSVLTPVVRSICRGIHPTSKAMEPRALVPPTVLGVLLA